MIALACYSHKMLTISFSKKQMWKYIDKRITTTVILEAKKKRITEISDDFIH